jgi:cell division protein FtsW (lipid II flippase)
MATDRRPARGRAKPPIEYSLLYTATLCLLAAGAVMVYSASSAESLLTTGDSSYFLKRYLIFAALGLAALHFLSRHGLKLVKAATPLLLFGSLGMTVAVAVAALALSATRGSPQPFGVLVPVYPLAMTSLWGARHGTFPPIPDRANQPEG